VVEHAHILAILITPAAKGDLMKKFSNSAIFAMALAAFMSSYVSLQVRRMSGRPGISQRVVEHAHILAILITPAAKGDLMKKFSNSAIFAMALAAFIYIRDGSRCFYGAYNGNIAAGIFLLGE
jgi:F0F1-type ATP synthase membrane subunit a